MTHFAEHTIDLYVLKPAMLTDAQREALRAHLEGCPGCRSLEAELRSFYEELQAASPDDSVRVEALMRQLYPLPSAIRHVRFTAVPGIQKFAGRYVSVLAAMTPPAATGRRFETVAVLASVPDKTLVRIQLDKQSDLFKFYFHADDPGKYEGAIASLPELHLDLVLDDKGQGEFRIPAGAVPADWSGVEALVKFPCAVLQPSSSHAAPAGGYTVEDPGGRYAVSIHAGGGSCTIETTHAEGAPDPSTLVVKGSSGATYLVELREGKGEINLSALPDTFILRLYA